MSESDGSSSKALIKACVRSLLLAMIFLKKDEKKRGITCLPDIGTSWRCNVIQYFTQLKFTIVVIWRLLRSEEGNMAWVIEYKGGKRYILDTKMGKSWRESNLGEKEKQRKERKKKKEGGKNHLGSPLRRKGGSGWAQWPYVKSINSRNPLDFWSENYLCMVDEGDHTAAEGQSEIPGYGPLQCTRGARGVYGQPLQRSESVWSTHEESYADAKRHWTSTEHLGGYR